MGKITESILKECIRLYFEEEKSMGEIGKILNIDRSSITYQFRKHGLKARPVRKIDLQDFQEKEGTFNFDYFLGIIATDGCICNNTVSLEFCKDNIDILYYFKEFLNNKCSINEHLDKKDNIIYYKISFMNKDICKYLDSFGITPRKSLTLKLKYINWEVLLGIFDGDGSLSKDSRSLSMKFKIASGSIDFLNQIKTFLQLNEINSAIYHSSGNCYELIVQKSENVYKIYSNMYKNTSYFLRRKYDKFGPLVEKFTRQNSVNSGDEETTSNPEPSLNGDIIEGAETRNGIPK
jgi:hypothetical protein